MTWNDNREAIVRKMAAAQGVDPDLLVALIGLEPDHRNLHGYGARPRLKRAAELLIDAALAKRATDRT